MSGAELDRLIRALRLARLEFSAEDLADALWLAPRLPSRADALEGLRRAMEPEPVEPPPPPPGPEGGGGDRPPDDPGGAVPEREAAPPEGVDVHLPGPAAASGEGEGRRGIRVRLPDAPGLPDALAISRALRPLRRRRSTTRFFRLDESRTAERLAAGDAWLPVLVPGRERWLSAALVVDAGASMAIWRAALEEFQHLLETLGAFRKVERWWLDTEDPAWTREPDSPAPLFASQQSHVYRRPLDVVDASGRQLILVVSDCVSDAWWDGRVARLLRLWGRSDHTAIVQVLPRKMWKRTALGPAREVVLRSPRAACPNAHLHALTRTRFRGLRRVSAPGAIPMPILNLDAATLRAWSRWLAQDAGGLLDGRLLEPDPPDQQSDEDDSWMQGIGQPFLTLASGPARKLANIMAVAPPFNLPLLRVIRESMLRGEATQVHEAEFLLGGLVKIIGGNDLRVRRPDEVLYDFRSEELRRTLRAAVRMPDALNLLRIEEVSRYLGQRLGQPHDFPAYLASPDDYEGALPVGPVASPDPIARFTSDILQWFGEPYAGLLRTGTGAPRRPDLRLAEAFGIAESSAVASSIWDPAASRDSGAPQGDAPAAGPEPRKARWLFLAATPGDLPALDVQREFREIREAIDSSAYRDDLQLDFRADISRDDLRKVLWTLEPHLLHIRAHGSGDLIALARDRGGSDRIGRGELEALVSALPPGLRLVVLNAPNSFGLAEVLARHVGCAVGIRGSVADSVAIRFAASFYRALGAGGSVREAFDMAVRWEEIYEPGGVAYALLTQPGVDPSQVFLVSASLEGGPRGPESIDERDRSLVGADGRPRILVAGSCRDPAGPGEFDTFTRSCRLLGTALAEAELPIIVGSSSPETADYHVLEGANRAARPAEILVIRPTERADIASGEGRFTNLSVRRQVFDERWREIRLRQVLAAAAVVVIGGGEGTREILQLAEVLGKPVLPLGVVSGASRAAWPTARRTLTASGLSEATINTLEKGFDPAVIVEALRGLLRPTSSEPPGVRPPEPGSPAPGSHPPDALDRPDVAAARATVHGILLEMREQIEILYHEKSLHDRLHELDFRCVQPILLERRSFPADEGARERLESYQDDLDLLTDEIRAGVDRVRADPAGIRWTDWLQKASEFLRAAIETSDSTALEKAAERLGRVISREPPRINARMRAAADRLDVRRLAEATDVLSGLGIGGASDEDRGARVRALQEGMADLIHVARRLTALVEEHDRWQQLDVELRHLAARLGSGLDDLEFVLGFVWSETRSLLEPLVTGSSEPWAERIRKAQKDLQEAIAARDVARARRSFERYREYASQQFYRVDQQVLSLCGRLRELIASQIQAFAPDGSPPTPGAATPA